jgi:hypothetical protein
MKFVLTALVAGFVGFVVGGGTGLVTGFLGGAVTGAFSGAKSGMCLVVDTAIQKGILTPAQAESIGTDIVKKSKADDITKIQGQLNTSPEDSEACKKMIAAIAKASK